jgi:hypothetical protein
MIEYPSFNGLPGTDKELLGECFNVARDDKEPFANQAVYRWYFEIGRMLKPKRIAEIGVRFGYSGKALMMGSGAEFYEGWDDESYEPGSIAWATDKAKLPNIHKCDSQRIDHLPNRYDLVHVDGDHSTDGCFHDCYIAWEALFMGGWLLIDDIEQGPVLKGVKRFCSEKKVIPWLLPSDHALALIQKTDSLKKSP